MPVYKEKISGRWFFKVSIKNRQFMRRGFLTKQQARYAEIDFLKKSNEKIIEDMLFTQLVWSYFSWLEGQLKSSVIYTRRLTLNKYFIDMFPNVRISKIIYADFERWKTKLLTFNLSTKKTNEHIALMKKIFEYASIYLNYSGVDYKKLVFVKNYEIKKPIIKNEVLLISDLKKIYSRANDMYKLLLLLWFMLGIRFTEATALQTNKCYDSEYGVLYIFQTVNNKLGTGKFEITSPKSLSSNRYYILTGSLKKILDDYIYINRLVANKFIFSRDGGKTPISTSTVRRYLLSITGDINFHPHLLRHTNVSELSANNINIEDIALFEGHSSSDITKKYYLHKTFDKQNEINEVLEKLYLKII